MVRINQVWNSVPSQLAKENKKFIYGVVKQGARAKDYVLAIQAGMQVIPVEVKAEENLQSKSLKATIAKYPGMKGFRFSMSDYREQDDITNVPLYGARGYLETYN